MSAHCTSDGGPDAVRFAKKGQLSKLTELLDKDPVNVNKTEPINGRSALYFAAYHGHKKCLKELLRRGANPNQRDANGETPCHAAVLGGRPPNFPESTRNPVTGTRRIAVGCYNYISYYLHDAKTQCKCLEHLLRFGGDLNAQTCCGETPKDIAMRQRKMELLEMIVFYFDLQLEATKSGGSLISSYSPDDSASDSQPLARPHWMQAVAKAATELENASPLTSKTSLFYKGRCRNIFDYSFVFSAGRRISPGAIGAVPEIMPSEVLKTCANLERVTDDGCVWSRAVWSGSVLVTLRQLVPQQGDVSSVMNVDSFMREIDNLSVMRHPNICLLMAVCTGPARADMFLALEALQPSSVHQQLHGEQKAFTQKQISKIMAGVTSAVSYLHTTKGVTHNILSSHAVYLNLAGIPKLTNMFCCSKPSTPLPGELSNTLRLYLPWVSPELMHTKIPQRSGDVYSLGVLLWELWSGDHPWPGLTPPELGRVLIKEGQRLIITRKHHKITPILKTCFCAPIGRLTVEQFLSQVEFLERPDQCKKKV